MKVAVFSAKAHDRSSLLGAGRDHPHDLTFHDAHLGAATTPLAAGCRAVCVFVNDRLDAAALAALAGLGVQLVALRCAGYNNVDLAAARDHRLTVVRVPAYSPFSVAEHAMALILSLNRQTHHAYCRVREGNFALDGLMGFDLHGRTAGVIGTGRIGAALARILTGFGCRVLANDPVPNHDCEVIGVRYADRATLYAESDIISLHCPLTADSHYLINAGTIKQMKPGVMLINTSRGKLLDTRAVIAALKSGRIGHLGLDVYEEEEQLFFENLSGEVIQDDVFSRLLTFPNVLITGHQAFFTREAVAAIASTTLANLSEFERRGACANAVPWPAA